MKNKIKKEVIKWYKNIENPDDKSVETFVDLIMNETTDAIIEEIQKELQEDFRNDTLKHNLAISPEWYLELKLKEAKKNFSKKM